MKARQIEIRKQANLSADRHTQLIGDWAEHRIGFINGAEWADAHPHWISVDDELPKEDGRYLFYHTITGVQSAYYYNDLSLDKAVTHWMPLPQAPKKGGKDDIQL